MAKKHYFEVVMNSYSEGELNQEVIIREYAKTGGELALKQMTFSKDVLPAIIDSFDKMSQSWQEQGMQEAGDALNGGKPASVPAEPQVTSGLPVR